MQKVWRYESLKRKTSDIETIKRKGRDSDSLKKKSNEMVKSKNLTYLKESL